MTVSCGTARCKDAKLQRPAILVRAEQRACQHRSAPAPPATAHAQAANTLFGQGCMNMPRLNLTDTIVSRESICALIVCACTHVCQAEDSIRWAASICGRVGSGDLKSAARQTVMQQQLKMCGNHSPSQSPSRTAMASHANAPNLSKLGGGAGVFACTRTPPQGSPVRSAANSPAAAAAAAASVAVTAAAAESRRSSHSYASLRAGAPTANHNTRRPLTSTCVGGTHSTYLAAAIQYGQAGSGDVWLFDCASGVVV